MHFPGMLTFDIALGAAARLHHTEKLQRALRFASLTPDEAM